MRQTDYSKRPAAAPVGAVALSAGSLVGASDDRKGNHYVEQDSQEEQDQTDTANK